MNHFFINHIAQLGWFIYPLIALLIFLEGEAIIYSVMFLSYQGTLNIYAVITVICLSVLLTDASSYAIGVYGPRYLPRLAKFYEKLVTPIDVRLQKMSFGVFLISKFTYGLHRAIMIRSGMLKLDIVRFFKIDLLTSAIWIAVISVLAYGSWSSVKYLRHTLRYTEIILACGIVILIASSHIVSHFSKKKLLENKK